MAQHNDKQHDRAFFTFIIIRDWFLSYYYMITIIMVVIELYIQNLC